MRIIYTLIVFSSLFLTTAMPQQDSLNGWFPSSEVALNISQISFSNWSQGGENSLTWAFISTNGLLYRYNTWNFRNNLKLSYGRTKISGEESRVNDNELFFETVLEKNIGWMINPFISNNIRTPIAEGYDYKADPDTQLVGFFDPGYVTQSVGFKYGTLPGFTVRAGVALQEIFSDKFRFKYTDDPETPESEAFKLETGIESVAEADYNIAEQFNYKSNLRLFSQFKQLDVWDVRWDNIFTAKISDFINVNLNILLLYDIKQTRRTQLKEALQLGFFYKLI